MSDHIATFIHRGGRSPCGRVAFFYDTDGAPENMIEHERVTYPDDTRPAAGDVMVCGSCGREISPAALDAVPGKWNIEVE